MSPDTPGDRPEERGEGLTGEAGADEETEVEPATWAARRARERAAEGDGAGDGESAKTEEPEAPDAVDEAEEPPDEFEFDEDGAEADEPASDQAEDDGAVEATIEADTVAVADEEEAREAALTGLRARTEEQAAKRRAGRGSATVEMEAVAGDETAPAEAEAEGEEEDEAAEAAGAEAAEPPVPPGAAPAVEEEKPARRTLWARFVAASFLIVASMATATAVTLLVYAADLAEGLGGLERLQGDLTEVESGEPQNFLILGSDKRADDEGGPGRSDTTLLLRIQPGEPGVISMLSIPRDLRVNIPGYGVAKFNAAYAEGGPKLTLEVVKQLTGLDIHHAVNVDFLGFAEAVNAIDCVYIDVDRHYYIGPELDISEIDIQAGYQRLCGLKALQYVRYRHTDNDLVRSARQQDFLREARQKVPPLKLLNDSGDLIEIFKEHTTSDINSATTLINLIELLFDARNAPVQEIHFPTTSLDEGGYVTSSNEQIQNVVQRFLDPTATQEGDGDGGPDGKGQEGGGGDKDDGGGKPEEPEPPPEPELIDSSALGQQFAVGLLDDTTAGGSTILDFPVFYPTRLTPDSQFSSESRAFLIDGPADEVYRGYKLVVSATGSFGETAYYGVSGTDWKDPPILENPSEEREIDGRSYQLYYDGDRLRLVAFKTDRATYWVTNTLTQELSESEMLAIAQSLTEYTG
jgi:LCP family protein required for cell wall assembly